MALWRGERPRVGDLTGVRATVEALVAGGRLEVDEDGRLVGVHGLVARPTAHRIEHASGVAHTWCAFDAVGIPAALGIDAAAVTACPACGTRLRVGVRHGVPEDDGRLRLWLPGGECTHLVDDFCRHANLYCDADHLAAVVRPGTPGKAVTVTETSAMGRVTWDDVAVVLVSAGGTDHDRPAAMEMTPSSAGIARSARPARLWSNRADVGSGDVVTSASWRRYATGGQDFVAELGKLLAMALPRIAPMKAVTGELPRRVTAGRRS